MPAQRTPSYRLHKASGHAIVTLAGRDVYLGPHGTPESREKYNRVIAEWQSNQRRLLQRDHQQVTVAELIAAYMRWADTYYRKNGQVTKEVQACVDSFNPLRALYGRTPAGDFRPRCLKAVREHFVASGICRKTVNARAQRIKRLFKWATENELVPPGVHEGLRCVAGLRKGRTDAHDPPPVRPVDDQEVRAILPHLQPPIAAMVELQLLTGMRPGEIVIMRTGDLDRSGKVWIYRPSSHKTEHHGAAREVPLGPKAQGILQPWLRADPAAFLFSPVEAEASRHHRMRMLRKTPVQPSQQNRRKKHPRNSPRQRYDVTSYRHAIHRACDKAEVPRWSPNRLRHTCATRLRKEYGIDAARVILGHRSPLVTEIYAEIDRTKATQIMGDVG